MTGRPGFLPAENNFWRVLGLIISHGFSRSSIEAEMETRAEVAALAMSPHTRLVLAHIGVFLEGDPLESVHASGFRRLAQRLARRLEDVGHVGAASRWHLLDPAVVREQAQEMLRGLW